MPMCCINAHALYWVKQKKKSKNGCVGVKFHQIKLSFL